MKKKYIKPVVTKAEKLSQVAATTSPPLTLAASDRRLKTDISPLLKTDKGIQLYAFRYLWSNEMFVGVMAQDLAEQPQFASAVSIGKHGFYQVDYQAIGLNMMTLEQWNALPVFAGADNAIASHRVS